MFGIFGKNKTKKYNENVNSAIEEFSLFIMTDVEDPDHKWVIDKEQNLIWFLYCNSILLSDVEDNVASIHRWKRSFSEADEFSKTSKRLGLDWRLPRTGELENVLPRIMEFADRLFEIDVPDNRSISGQWRNLNVGSLNSHYFWTCDDMGNDEMSRVSYNSGNIRVAKGHISHTKSQIAIVAKLEPALKKLGGFRSVVACEIYPPPPR